MRNILIIIIIGVSIIGIMMGCESNYQSERTKERPEILFDQSDWSKTDPLALLNILKKHPESTLMVLEAPRDWIKEEHVRQLMQLIDSQEPAAPVVSIVSSYYPNNKSTVGTEAMFLIEGFRIGHYPPSTCSLHYFKDINNSRNELRKWWSERKMSK
jgi:hypothetical protein